MKIILYALCASILCACASSPEKPSDCHALVLASSDSHNLKGSIVTEISEIDSFVENGDAFEVVSLHLPDATKKIYLPKGTTVVRSAEKQRITIYLKKSFGYAGHPGKRTSILDERKKMGAAIRIRGNIFILAFYGAWESFEGGSSIDAVVILPPHIQISEHDHLNFKDTDRWQGSKHFKSNDWFILPASPDPRRNFKLYSTVSQ